MTFNYNKSIKEKEATILKYYKKLDKLNTKEVKPIKRSSKTKKKRVIIPKTETKELLETNQYSTESTFQNEKNKDSYEEIKTKKAKREYKPSDFIVED